MSFYDSNTNIKFENLIFSSSALMTHASVPAEQRAVLGISDNFIRLSIGLENADDLIADINQALIKAVISYFYSNIFILFLFYFIN